MAAHIAVYLADSFKFGWAITQFYAHTRSSKVHSSKSVQNTMKEKTRRRKFFISFVYFTRKCIIQNGIFVQPKLSSAFYIEDCLSSVFIIYALCIYSLCLHLTAYILFNSVLNIFNYIQWFKINAVCFLCYFSLFVYLSIFLSVCCCVSVSSLVPFLFFFYLGKKFN